MNFKPTRLKVIFSMVMFLFLIVLGSSSQCLGGAIFCEPSQEFCGRYGDMTDAEYERGLLELCVNNGLSDCAWMLESEQYNAEFKQIFLDYRGTYEYYPSNCQDMDCRQQKCGGIGWPIIAGGPILAYIILSLIKH